jgi:predicted metal-dependent hydrolase
MQQTIEGGERREPIPVPRRVPFDWDKEVMTLWYPNLLGTLMLNAYTIIFPLFERLMIRWVGEAARDIDEPHLRARVAGFTAQEAGHAREHECATRHLEKQGFRSAGLVALLLRLFRDGLDPWVGRLFGEKLGRKVRVGMCAAAEHWTAVLAEANLRDLPREFPMGPMAKLYCWHGYEELEHKSVVFDVYRAIGGGALVRVFTFLYWTACFVFVTGLATIYLMVQLRPRYLFSTWMARDIVRYTLTDEKLFWHGLRGFFTYLAPGFHPSRHSTAEAEQRALEGLADERAYGHEALIRAGFSSDLAFRKLRGMMPRGRQRSMLLYAAELARDPDSREKLVQFVAARPDLTLHLTQTLRGRPAAEKAELRS